MTNSCMIDKRVNKKTEHRTAENSGMTSGSSARTLVFVYYVFPNAGQNNRSQKKGLHTGPHLSEEELVHICSGKYVIHYTFPVSVKDRGVDKWGGWRQSAFEYHTPINSRFGSHTPGFKMEKRRWQPRLQSLSLLSGSGSHQKHFWIMREGSWDTRGKRCSWSSMLAFEPE